MKFIICQCLKLVTVTNFDKIFSKIVNWTNWKKWTFLCLQNRQESKNQSFQKSKNWIFVNFDTLKMYFLTIFKLWIHQTQKLFNFQIDKIGKNPICIILKTLIWMYLPFFGMLNWELCIMMIMVFHVMRNFAKYSKASF